MRPRGVPIGRALGAFAAVALAVAACGPTAPTSPGSSTPTSAPPPSAVASPEVACDPTQMQPPPALTCQPAIAAAVAALGPAHPPILRATFRWGGLCPPGAPCAPPLGDAGIVIFDFASGPSSFVYVSSGAGGVVVATSPAPYPSGY